MKHLIVFNKREPLRFKHFTRKGYALFACLGREVLIGILSVATLTHAKADSISVCVEKAADSTAVEVASREVTLEDVEVTGSRAPLTRSQAARMVTVIDRADIAQSPVQSINDLLKYAVGVDVRQRGAIGAQTDIGIRGGTHEQITILLNGINICDPQTGHNAFDFPVGLDDVERIEVLEGPAARVYGTYSLVGAINIVTRTLDTTSGQVSLDGGSYGFFSGAARFNLSKAPSYPPLGGSSVGVKSLLREGVGGSLSASYARSDGFSRSKSGHLNADYSGGKVFCQGRYNDRCMTLRWHAGISDKGFGSNTFYSKKYDEQYEHTTKFFTAIYGETKGRVRFRPSLYWNRFKDRFELFRGNAQKYPFNEHRTDVYGLNLNAIVQWVGGQTAFGAEFRNEDIVSTNLGEPMSQNGAFSSRYTHGLNRSNLSFHLEHNVLLKRFTVSAGFIAVKNTWNEMPFQLYPGIDASYRIGSHWKVYASGNSSLRMPSFTELYYSVGGHQADKHLKPEKLTALEGGFKYRSSVFNMQASVFHNHAENMIDWIIDTSMVDAEWKSVNLTKINTLGVQVQATVNIAQCFPACRLLRHFNIAYTYLNQEKDVPANIQSQYSLEYLRHKLVSSLNLQLCRYLDLALHYRWQDRTGTYSDFNGRVCDYRSYGVLDAKLTWSQASALQLFLEANNVLDKAYVDYGNVPQPGFWMRVGVKLDF